MNNNKTQFSSEYTPHRDNIQIQIQMKHTGTDTKTDFAEEDFFGGSKAQNLSIPIGN